MLQICSNSGIKIQHSIPYTPQQNGVVKKKTVEIPSCSAHYSDDEIGIYATDLCYDIHYATDSELELVGYTDSNWEGDSIDKNSNSG